MATSNSNYGTVNADTPEANGTASPGDSSLLEGGKPGGEQSIGQRLRQHFVTPVSKKRADLALLSCYIITGLLDSSSVFIWGSFLSMQTGNTVYLGLGLAAPHDGNRWIRSAISILFFCFGSFIFARFHRALGGRKRWVLVSSYFLQLLCIIAAALMVTLGPETGTSGPVTRWIATPIALCAFQAGGQSYTSRVLQFGTLTSVVLTSIYLDLFSDAKLFAGLTENVERNRRVSAPLLLLVGAVIGGVWAHSSIGLAGALWTAVGLKAVVIITWCFWPADKEES